MTISRAMEQVFAALGITEADVLDSTEADWDKELEFGLVVWTSRWVILCDEGGAAIFTCVARFPRTGESYKHLTVGID